MAIYVFGSLAYDRIMNSPSKFSDYILPDKVHNLNVCFLIDQLEERLGGTAGNIAHSLALLGEKPIIVSPVGRDFSMYKRSLEEKGLSLEAIRVIPEEFTAGAYITTDSGNNQITAFNPGAMRHQCAYDFPKLNPAEDLAIIAPGNQVDMVELARFFKDKGVRYVFDPGQQIPAITPDGLLEALTGAYTLVCNDYEFAMIMKITHCTAEELRSRVSYQISTLSEHGSKLYKGEHCEEIAAVAVKHAPDPTGAGDAYRAGLLKGIVSGKSMAESAAMGATCASFCVELHGTQEHTFTPNEFNERYTKTFGA